MEEGFEKFEGAQINRKWNEGAQVNEDQLLSHLHTHTFILKHTHTRAR